MTLITLTSDLGTADPYVAMVKGTLYRLYSKITVVDISHEVPPFDKQRCAYIVRWAYSSFPKGTIHLFGCDPGTSLSTGGIVASMDGHYFIGPDNGIMSLIALEKPYECRHISNKNLFPDIIQPSFLIRDLYAYAAAYLASGGTFEEMGIEAESQQMTNREPNVTDTAIRGEIIYVDRFGNCITNITRDTFSRLKNGRSFNIIFRNHSLRKIYLEYDNSLHGGEPIALFGSTGHLEICAILGSASALFGLNIGHNITLEFNNK